MDRAVLMNVDAPAAVKIEAHLDLAGQQGFV